MTRGMCLHFRNDSERKQYIENKENWFYSESEDVIPVRTYTLPIDGATFISIVPLREVTHFNFEQRKTYTTIEYLHPAENIGVCGVKICLLKEAPSGTWYIGEPMSKTEIVKWMKEQEKDDK